MGREERGGSPTCSELEHNSTQLVDLAHAAPASARPHPTHAPIPPPSHLVHEAVWVGIAPLIIRDELTPPVSEVLLADPLTFGEAHIGPNPPLEGPRGAVVPELAIDPGIWRFDRTGADLHAHAQIAPRA